MTIKNIPITIIIPTLNEELNLPRLLDDLTRQSYTNFKVIVVDANSTDKTVFRTKQYKSKLALKVFVTKKKGVAYQRNFGAKKSSTDLLLFMDADNRVPPYFIQGLKFYSEMVDSDFISTAIEPDSKSNIDKLTAIAINIAIDISKNTPNPYILESMILTKRRSFELLNGFNENIHWHEGGDLLRRANKKNMKFEFIKTLKYTYSFRRLRKTGNFLMIQKIIKMELSRILLNDTKGQKVLYPMDGGSFYEIDKNKGDIIKTIISELFKTDQKEESIISKSIDKLGSIYKLLIKK